MDKMVSRPQDGRCRRFARRQVMGRDNQVISQSRADSVITSHLGPGLLTMVL